MSDFENLLERLGEICGDCDEPYFALFEEADSYTRRILDRGIILLDSSVNEESMENSSLVTVEHLGMEPNECHRDALCALKVYPKSSFMTGYVCCDGSWYVHSWLYSKKKSLILEPCISSVTECYYGFVLTEKEVKEFSREVFIERI